jgi:alkylated DNA repair dioxygenase AlkB
VGEAREEVAVSQGDIFAGVGIRPDVTHLPGVFVGLWTREQMHAALPLAQRTAQMYGKRIPVPRLEAWFGNNPYTFGGRTELPQPWPEELSALRRVVELRVDDVAATRGTGMIRFDSCFANYYRDGSDHIPWHADDEPWIGPVIASVTFGASRRFVMKHNATGATFEWSLGDGDLFVMWGGTQRDWKHAVPKTAKPVGPRLNLTFRQTVAT